MSVFTCRDHNNCTLTQITDQIYLGSHLPGRHHWEALIDMGITADIDMEFEHTERPRGIEIFLWLPTKDFHAPTQTQLLTGARMIGDLVSQGKKLYVHCRLGHSRSTTLLSAYFILQGETPQSAFALIKSKRPQVHLEQAQEDALEEFARLFKKART
jgi:protein-tyrosine phosphatase